MITSVSSAQTFPLNACALQAMLVRKLYFAVCLHCLKMAKSELIFPEKLVPLPGVSNVNESHHQAFEIRKPQEYF